MSSNNLNSRSVLSVMRVRTHTLQSPTHTRMRRRWRGCEAGRGPARLLLARRDPHAQPSTMKPPRFVVLWINLLLSSGCSVHALQPRAPADRSTFLLPPLVPAGRSILGAASSRDVANRSTLATVRSILTARCAARGAAHLAGWGSRVNDSEI